MNLDDLDNEDMTLCPRCGGMGWLDIGDCEDGIIEECKECDGYGTFA